MRVCKLFGHKWEYANLSAVHFTISAKTGELRSFVDSKHFPKRTCKKCAAIESGVPRMFFEWKP